MAIKGDSLEREIVEKLIEILDSPLVGLGKVNDELLNLLAKYKARVGEDSWLQRQYNKGLPDR